MRRRIVFLGVLASAALALVPVGVAEGAHVACGETITADTTLDSDLACSGNGIVIGAPGVDLDLNGHSVSSRVEGIFAQHTHSISIRNGSVTGTVSAIRFWSVTDGVIEDVTADGSVRLTTQPTRNVVRDSVVTGSIEVSELIFQSGQYLRPGDNRIERNRVDGINIYSADGNLVRDNDVTYVAVFGATRFGSGDGVGADDNVIEGNRIAAPGSAYAVLVALYSERTVVRDNDIVGGIFVTVLADDTLVEDNRIRDAVRAGIAIGDPPYETGPAVVRGNVVEKSGTDGIAVQSTAQGVAVTDNIVSDSGDDGIDADHAATTITANRAFANGDWGVEAVSGVSDGGGNHAWSNGQLAQCLNVVCGPGSTECRVAGSGSIEAADGDQATFRLTARGKKDGSTNGLIAYADRGPAQRVVVRARVTALTCTGSAASLFGRTAGSESRHFRIDVADGGRRADTFRIRLSGGYDSGEVALAGGDIRVR